MTEFKWWLDRLKDVDTELGRMKDAAIEEARRGAPR